MKDILLSTRPKWCEKICHEIGKDKNGKPIYEKAIEVRKGRPLEVPFRGLIYVTKPKKWYKCGPLLISDESLWLADGKVEMCDGLKFWADGADNYHCLNGKVIGEFICDKVEVLFDTNGNPENYMTDILPNILQKTALSYNEFAAYVGSRADKNSIYGWHISDVKIYDKPKELSEFRKSGFMTEEEWLFNLYPNTHCHYEAWATKFEIARPPQSWMFVEEIEASKEKQ